MRGCNTLVIKIFSFIKNRKNFILYSLLNILVKISGLATNIVIVRKLTVGDFGVFSVILMLVAFITSFGFSWSSSSIIYFGSREKQRFGSINKTFWARNIIIFFSLLITSIFFIVFAEQINTYVGVNISHLILLWLYVSVLENYLQQYFLAVKRQLLSIILSITAKAIYFVLILIFDFDVTTLVILNIVSHATVLLYIFAIHKRDIGKFEFDKAWFKDILSFSLWQLFGFSGVYLINFGDIAIIKYFMTEKDVGIYNAAYQLFLGVTTFANIISSYYASNVSSYFENKNIDRIKQFFYKERFYIFGVSIVVHLIIIILSKPIVLLLYGEKYLGSIIIINILLIGSMFRFLERFYMLYYNTNGKHKIQQIINIIGAIFNIGLSIILVKYLGLIGPAVATTISFILTTCFSVFYCEKRIKLFVNEHEL